MEGMGCVIKRAISSVWNTAPLYVTSRSITRFQPDVSAEFAPPLFGIFVPFLVNRMFVTFCRKYFIIRFFFFFFYGGILLLSVEIFNEERYCSFYFVCSWIGTLLERS